MSAAQVVGGIRAGGTAMPLPADVLNKPQLSAAQAILAEWAG